MVELRTPVITVVRELVAGRRIGVDGIIDASLVARECSPANNGMDIYRELDTGLADRVCALLGEWRAVDRPHIRSKDGSSSKCCKRKGSKECIRHNLMDGLTSSRGTKEIVRENVDLVNETKVGRDFPHSESHPAYTFVLELIPYT